MSEKTPTVAGRQDTSIVQAPRKPLTLSSSLKERLKRCGRYHSSPSAGTPQRKRLSPGPNHHSTDKTLNTENIAKKLCVHNVTENKQSVNDGVNHSMIGSILVEKQQSQPSENSHCQSESTKQLSVQSNMKQEQFRETYCSKTANHKNDSEIIREKTIENLRPEYNVTLSSESPGTKLSYLDTNRTPVSSRTMKRTDLMRGSKIDFDKKQTDKTSNSDNLISNDSKLCELSTSASVTDSDSCVATGTVGTCREAGKDGSGDTVRDRDSLLKEVSEKEETLRKLKMVKMYQTKNNLTQLQVLIDKWRSVAQEGLQDLHCALPEPKPSLTELLQHLGVDPELVKFDATEESFDL